MYADVTVIYADILFVINFSLDYLCLFIAGRLLNRWSKPLRLVAAGVLGGLFSFVPYITQVPPYISLPLNLSMAAIICLIAFGYGGIKPFLLVTVTFMVSSALMGGVITALYSLSGRYSNGIYTEADAFSFAAICFVSAVIVFAYGMISKRKIHTRCAEVRIYLGKEKVSARLLADSGNLVTEPFSALPVIILSASALPPPYDDPESEIFPLQPRIIPFGTSAGGGCFMGFRPDRIDIIRLGKKPLRADAYIAVDTSQNRYSGYDGIIPTSIL